MLARRNSRVSVTVAANGALISTPWVPRASRRMCLVDELFLVRIMPANERLLKLLAVAGSILIAIANDWAKKQQVVRSSRFSEERRH
jgi:hypothetical protein